MWTYERRLEYPVKICKPDPNAAQAIISQLGGPNGELGASLRYLNQRYTMTDRKVAGCLTDIGTEGAKEPLFGEQTREKGAPCLSRDPKPIPKLSAHILPRIFSAMLCQNPRQATKACLRFWLRLTENLTAQSAHV